MAGSIEPVPVSQSGTPATVRPRRQRATSNELGMSTYSVSLIWIALPLRCMRMIRRFCGGPPEMSPIGSPTKNVGCRSNTSGASIVPTSLPSWQPWIQSRPCADPVPSPTGVQPAADSAANAAQMAVEIRRRLRIVTA